MPNLDYAELEAVARRLVDEIELCEHEVDEIEIVRAALTDIAKRALEWAAMTDQAFHPDSFDRYVSESPRVLLSNALAALDAPVSDTPKPSQVPKPTRGHPWRILQYDHPANGEPWLAVATDDGITICSVGQAKEPLFREVAEHIVDCVNARIGTNPPDTSKQRTVPLTDAEMLKKLPLWTKAITGGRLTEGQLRDLIEKIRWS